MYHSRMLLPLTYKCVGRCADLYAIQAGATTLLLLLSYPLSAPPHSAKRPHRATTFRTIFAYIQPPSVSWFSTGIIRISPKSKTDVSVKHSYFFLAQFTLSDFNGFLFGVALLAHSNGIISRKCVKIKFTHGHASVSFPFFIISRLSPQMIFLSSIISASTKCPTVALGKAFINISNSRCLLSSTLSGKMSMP